MKVSGKAVFMMLGASLVWFALAVQGYFTVARSLANGLTVADGVVRYVGFFTIMTNTLVALALSLPLLSPGSALGRFFSRPVVQSAIAAYIVLVGAVYEVMLRRLWHPEGLQFVADLILHDIMPVIYLLFWVIYVSKSELRWKHALLWLAYPAAYCLYVLARGALTGFYPYPFINVGVLGYGHALMNAAGLLVLFWVTGLVLVAAGRMPLPSRQGIR